ncbi:MULTISPECIES: hypothetical protein [unclassified Corallococcus]|uniref:hypothetical protein n=1 Tax=unclassified Corallococcus TaxID=2685029 RepID=UPI001A8C2C94|nr:MULTISPECIES: hypothetical protein [unclassified Corallococcus]MBN9687100.1 hypothetical protein [Corallococcus sp. NCSPR001]WAS89072.1 hypothetical protein O0N60_19320 [Corallococcus sp. NCRR]
MPCPPATITLWARCRRRSAKAALYALPVEGDMWLPTAVATESREPEKSPHGDVYPLRVVVRRNFLAREWPNLLAKLEAGAPACVVAERPRLVVSESSIAKPVMEFRAALDASRLEFEGAATVLGLSVKQVRALYRGYLRVESEAELVKVEAALKAELERQSKVTGLPVDEGIYWRKLW